MDHAFIERPMVQQCELIAFLAGNLALLLLYVILSVETSHVYSVGLSYNVKNLFGYLLLEVHAG